MGLPTSFALRLVEALLIFERLDENSFSLVSSLLETLSESDHVHLVSAQIVRCLDGLLASASLEKATVMLTLFGRLLSRPRFLSAVLAGNHAARVVHAIRHLMESGGAASRSACYFALLKLVAVRDPSALRLGTLATTWEVVCLDIAQGGGGSSSLRTNGLALLCFLLQSSDPALAPWPKIADALKVVVCSGEQQQQLLACQVFLEAVHLGFGGLLLERAVGLHVLDALSRVDLASSVALLKRLVQLTVIFATRFPQSFQLQISSSIRHIARLAQTWTAASSPEYFGMSLELMGAIIPLSGSDLLEPAGVLAVISSPSVARDLKGPLAISWMQLVHTLAAAPCSSDFQLSIRNHARNILERCCSETGLSAQHVGLAISLACLLDEADLMVKVALAHQSLALENPLVCLELVRVCSVCTAGAPPVQLFTLLVEGAFQARRAMDTSSDQTLRAIFEGLLVVAQRMIPWWRPRISQIQSVMLALPDVSSWLETIEHFAADADSISVMLGLFCCGLMSANENWIGCKVSAIKVLTDCASKTTALSSSFVMELSVALCLSGWSDASSVLSDGLARALVSANVELSCDMPPSFLSWAFRARALESVASRFLYHLLSDGSGSHVLASLLGSSQVVRASVGAHLVKLMTNQRSKHVLFAWELFLESGQDAVSLLSANGAVAALKESVWEDCELPTLCRLLLPFVQYGAMDASIALTVLYPHQNRVDSLPDDGLLSWLNAYNLILILAPSLSSFFLSVNTAAVLRPTDLEALRIAQMEFSALLVSGWNPSLFVQCNAVMTDPSASDVAVAVALFAVRRMLDLCDASSVPPLEELYDLWLLLQAQVVTDARELVQTCAVLSMDSLVRLSSKIGPDRGQLLASLPWTKFTWRCAVERIGSAPPEAILSAPLLHFVQVLLPHFDDRSLLGTAFVDRLALEALKTNKNNTRLMALVLALLDCAVPVEKHAFLVALEKAALPDAHEALPAVICSCLDFHGALVFPQSIWEMNLTPLHNQTTSRLLHQLTN